MLQNNDYTSKDPIKTFELMKSNISASISVCRIAKITSVNDDLILCQDLNDKQMQIPVIAHTNNVLDADLVVDKIVCILFTDTDYRTNLNRAKNGLSMIQTKLKTTHNINYGIIIGIIGE